MELNYSRFLLGIDPSFTNFGCAIIDLENKKELKLFTGEYFDSVKWINKNLDLSKTVAVVENPNLDPTAFYMWGMIEKGIKDLVRYELYKMIKKVGLTTKKVTLSDVESIARRALKQAQNVGENKAAAKLIITQLKSKNIPVLEVAPSSRDRADRVKGFKKAAGVKAWKMPTKLNAALFKELTGYEGRSNEHNRDAATLIFGYTLAAIEYEIAKAYPKNKPLSYPGPLSKNEFLLNGTKKAI